MGGHRIRKAIVALAVGAGALVSPLAMETASAAIYNCSGSAPQVAGNMFASLKSTSTGIKWSGWVTGFTANASIQYCWEIYRNGVRIDKRQSGTYRTDRYGNHSKLPDSFPQQLDCGKGNYNLYIWVVNSSGRRSEKEFKTLRR